MRNPKYLALSRHRVYYLRWPLPQALDPRHRPQTIKVSLRTRDPRRALSLARYLCVAAEELMMDGSTDGMTLAQMRALMKSHFLKRLAERREEIDRNGRLSALDIEGLRTWAAIERQDLNTGQPILPDNDAANIRGFIDEYGLPVRMGTPTGLMLGKEIKRAYRDYCEAVLAYDRSLDSYDFTEQLPGALVAQTPAQATPGITLRELTEAYAAEKLLGRLWAKKTESERQAHIALLHEVLGQGTDIRSLNAASAKLVKDTLSRYPKNRNKNPRTRGLALPDALAVADVQTIDAKTINKYLQTYSDLFRWAKQNGHVDANLFEGLAIRLNRREAVGERDPFTVDQVQTMLAALLGDQIGSDKRPFRKWGPLIGIYTGARLGEIAQIHLTDIREIGGVPCFDLNDDDEGKHLKTDASRRLVPIHRRLIELGLLNHVDALRGKSAVKLFPELTYDINNGWGRALGRWFNERFLPKLGMKTDDLVFHSLRHMVITELHNADIEEPIVKAIVGHAQEGVHQQHYFKQGYKLDQLSAALHRLPY